MIQSNMSFLKKNTYYLTHITFFGLYKDSEQLINKNKSIKKMKHELYLLYTQEMYKNALNLRNFFI